MEVLKNMTEVKNSQEQTVRRADS